MSKQPATREEILELLMIAPEATKEFVKKQLQATREEMSETIEKQAAEKDTPGIGCGVYPLLLEKSYFADPCSWHDQSYIRDSWVQKNMTRKQCDDWFLRQTLEIAGSNKLRQAQAYLFYGIARALGSFWWEGAK